MDYISDSHEKARAHTDASSTSSDTALVSFVKEITAQPNYKPLSREEQEAEYFVMMEAINVAYEGDISRATNPQQLDESLMDANQEKLKRALEFAEDPEYKDLDLI